MKTIKSSTQGQKSSLSLIVGLTLFLGSVSVFFSLYAPYVNSKAFIISFGTVLCLLIYLFIYPIQKIREIRRSAVLWGISVYALSLVIISVASIDPTLSWFGEPVRATGTLLLLILSTFSLIIGSSLSQEQIRKYVFFPVSISGALIALSVFAEKGGWKFLASASDGGVLGNTSYTGTYLIFSFFATLYLLAISRPKNGKILYGFIAILSVFNPVFINFSFSLQKGIFDIVGDARGAAVSLGIGITVGLFFWLSTSSNRNFKLIGKSAITVSIIASIVLFIQLLNSSSSLHQWFVAKASGTRFIYWSVALEGFKDRPMIGTGPETYVYTYQKHFNPEMYLFKNNIEVWADKPHSVFVEVLSTGGVVGTFGYLLLLGTIIFSIYKGYKINRDRYFLVSMYALITAYLVNNLLIFDTPTSYVLLFAVAGSVIAYEKNNLNEYISFRNRSQKILQVAVGLIMLGGVAFILIPQITKMSREYKDFTIPFDEKIALYPKIEAGSSYGSGINLSQRTGQLYEDQLVKNINVLVNETQNNKELVVKVIDSAVNTQLELFKKYPKNVQGLVNIGKLESIKMALLNKPDENSLNIMTQAAKDAIQLAPKNPAGYWLLAQKYTYEQNFDSAFAAFEEARTVEPEIAESHNNLIRLAKYLKDQKKVDSLTQRAYEESSDFKNGRSL